MYLVILRHHSDDIPVGLFTTRHAAVFFAKDIEKRPAKRIREMFHADCTTHICVVVVTFANSVPMKCEIVKEFDGAQIESGRPASKLRVAKN